MRIVSLVPSLTELLFDLGLENHIVGVTRFCIHPKEKTKNIATIGGTKNIKISKIVDLKPDLVVANKEENSKADIDSLSKLCTVWVTEIATINDALHVIQELGDKTQTRLKADELVQEIKHSFLRLKSNLPQKKVAYVIWNNPIMLAGRMTFINELMKELNWVNVIEGENSRYPETTLEKLNKLSPDYILLSSEPFPFKEEHLTQFTNDISSTKVVLVNGEMFSWYGSRMRLMPNYFMELLNSLD